MPRMPLYTEYLHNQADPSCHMPQAILSQGGATNVAVQLPQYMLSLHQSKTQRSKGLCWAAWGPCDLQCRRAQTWTLNACTDVTVLWTEQGQLHKVMFMQLD